MVDLSITMGQYAAAIIEDKQNFTMPDVGANVKVITDVFSIGADMLAAIIPSLSDFRLYFAAVAVVGPITIVFGGVVSLNPLRVIIWYLLLLVSILVTLIGAVGNIVISSVTSIRVDLSSTVLLACVVAGPVMLGLCVVAFWQRETLLAFGADKVSDKDTIEERIAEETADISWPTLVIRAVLSSAFIFFGLVFLFPRQLGVVSRPFDTSLSGFAALAAGFGYAFLVIGSLMFVYMLVGLFQCGREGQWRLASWLEENFMRGFLIMLSIAYIPLVTPLFLVFNCNDFTCPTGYRLLDAGSVMPANKTTLASGSLCQGCHVWPDQRCPVALQRSACAAVTESRLEADLALQCNAALKTFFWPAAGIMVVAVVLGIPAIFYALISESVAIIEERFPIRVPSAAEVAMQKRKEADEEQARKEEEEKQKRIEAWKQQKQRQIAGPVPSSTTTSGNKYAMADSATPKQDESGAAATFVAETFEQQQRSAKLAELAGKRATLASEIAHVQSNDIPAAQAKEMELLTGIAEAKGYFSNEQAVHMAQMSAAAKAGNNEAYKRAAAEKDQSHRDFAAAMASAESQLEGAKGDVMRHLVRLQRLQKEQAELETEILEHNNSSSSNKESNNNPAPTATLPEGNNGGGANGVNSLVLQVLEDPAAGGKPNVTSKNNDGEKKEGQQQQETEEEEDEYATWKKQVVATNNVARFLYQPFFPGAKYTRLVFLVQKLVSVFLGTFVIRILTLHPTWIQLCSTVVIHSAGFVMLCFIWPFLYTHINVIALIMELVLAATGVLSVLIFADVSMPSWSIILILICNGVLPAVALILALVLELTAEASAAEEAEKVRQKELQQEIEGKKKEQAAKVKVAKEKEKEEEELRKAADLAYAALNSGGVALLPVASAPTSAPTAAAATAVVVAQPSGSEPGSGPVIAINTGEGKKGVTDAAAGAGAGNGDGSGADAASGSDDDDEEEDEDEDGSDLDLDNLDVTDLVSDGGTAAKELLEALKALGGEIAAFTELAEVQQVTIDKIKEKKSHGGLQKSKSMPAVDSPAESPQRSGSKVLFVEMPVVNVNQPAAATTTTTTAGAGDDTAPPPQVAATADTILASTSTATPVKIPNGGSSNNNSYEHAPLLPHQAAFTPPPPTTATTMAAPAPATSPLVFAYSAFNRPGATPQPQYPYHQTPPSALPQDPFASVQTFHPVASPFSASSSSAVVRSPPALNPFSLVGGDGSNLYGNNSNSGSFNKKRRRSRTSSVGDAAAAAEKKRKRKRASCNDENGTMLQPAEMQDLLAQESDAVFLLDDEAATIESELPEDFQFMSREEQVAVRKKIARKKQLIAQRRANKIKLLEDLLEKRRAEAEERLLICQSNVDYEINQVVKDRLNCALMIQGLFGLFALALCAVALLSSPASAVSVSDFDSTRSNTTEFVGYANFDVFTSKCCCTATVDTNHTPHVAVEKWICENGRIKERVRATKPFSTNASIVDGFQIRSLCNVTFADGCVLATTEAKESIQFVVCNETKLPDVTLFMKANLW